MVEVKDGMYMLFVQGVDCMIKWIPSLNYFISIETVLSRSSIMKTTVEVHTYEKHGENAKCPVPYQRPETRDGQTHCS